MFANYQTAKNVLGNAAAIVLLAVASFGFAPAAHADYFATTTFNSTNSSTSSINLFVVPAGVTSITADLTAAGGAGAGGAYTFGGGAGGAGESFSQTIPVTPGQIIGYEVGAGGIGGTSGFINVNAGNGGIGGNTVFGTTTAFGGQGGKGAIYGDSSSGKGGVAGGIGATAGGNGDDQINANRTYGGTGGVSAVTGSVAGQGGYGDATTLTLPQAGKIGGGGGGASGWASANGTPQDTGANGGDGQIVLSYYVDNTAPTITINGSSTLVLEASSTGVYTDAGATAIDVVNGATTSIPVMTVSNNVDLAATGTYYVVYTATDAAGNVATATRTVIVEDTTAPTITFVPGTQVFEATGPTTTPVLVPITATDNLAATPTISYFPTSFALGTTTVTWTATDASGNSSTATSAVVIMDTTPPAIVLNGTNPMSVLYGTSFIDPGATAFDLVDGTTTVFATGTVNTFATGTYAITYTSSDLSGNIASSTRTVDVVATAPVLTTLTIAPLSPSVSVGSTTQFVASTTDQYGNPFASSVIWVSMNPSVGTIDPSTGLFTAVSTGTTTVEALSGALSTSTVVTVTPSSANPDLSVLVTNSTIDATFYVSEATTSGAIANITGTTTIDSSNLTTTSVDNSTIATSTATTTTASNTNLALSSAVNSTLTNSDIGNCTIINSLVKNYFARNCYVAFSTLDPSPTYYFIDSTTTNSQIFASNIFNSVISNHSYVATSSATSSTIASATTTDSVIATSTITDSVVASSTVTDSTITNNSNISSSTLTNVNAASSTITNTTLANATTTNAVIDNNIIDSGTITIGGVTYTITTPTPISSLGAAVPVTSITVSASSTSVAVGSTLQMTATVLPANASTSTVAWSVASGTGAATIDTAGLLTGVSAGNVTVTASSTDGSGVFGTTTITITSNGGGNVAVTGVTLAPAAVTLPIASTTQLSVSVLPANATNQNVTWNSDNTSVATVDTAGLVTAVATGTANVTVTTADGGFVATTTVTVTATSTGTTTPVLTTLSIVPQDPSVSVGSTTQFTATTLDQNGAPFATTTTWTSASTTIGTINATGLFTAASAGTTTVTATAGTLSTSTTVTVTATSTGTTTPTLVSIAITNPAAKLVYTVGDTLDLSGLVVTGTYSDNSTSTQTVTPGDISGFNTSAPNVNEILTITIAGKTTSYAITVNAASGPVAVTGVSVSTSSLELFVGNTATIIETIAPANATNQNVTWTSSNASIASVSSGVVTANTTGTATITVTTADGNFTATTSVLVTTPGAPIAVTGVTLDQSAMTITAGQTGTLHATIAPANATNQNISWNSDNTSVATVNGGVVTAVAAGTAHVKVTTADGNFTAQATITVNPSGPVTVPVTGVTLNQSSINLAAGDTATLVATVAPAGATNQNVTWSSASSSIATVSTSGVVTAVATGTANITVTTADGGFTASATVNVSGVSTTTVPVTGVTVSTSSIDLLIGDTATILETIAPAGATNQNVNWNSDNPSVATVTGGVVTAVATGTANVTVTTADGGFVATTTVTVTAPVNPGPIAVTGISVNPTSFSIAVGASQLLSETIAPANATNQSVTWNTDNSSIATVSTSGVVTAVATGTANVTVTTADGGFVATTTVTVTAPASTSTTPVAVTGVSVNPTSLTLTVGNTSTILETVAPANATNQNISWSTASSSIATVANGVVTAVAPGTTDIVVTTADGGFTATTTVTVNPVVVTPTLVSIAITNPAAKLVYTVGDTLDLSGLVVTGTYSDNSTSTEPITTANISGFNASTPVASETLTIIFGGKTASYVISVNAAATSTPTSTPPVITSGGGGATQNTPPTIVIEGANPATVSVGSTYVDAGAKAYDANDVTITNRIVTTNNVNTSVAGSYAVTYTVTDIRGNTSTAARTVNVVGPTSSSATASSTQAPAGTTVVSASSSEPAQAGEVTTGGANPSGANVIPFIDLGNTLPSQAVATATVKATSTATATVAATTAKTSFFATALFALSHISGDLLAIILTVIAFLLAGFVILKVNKN